MESNSNWNVSRRVFLQGAMATTLLGAIPAAQAVAANPITRRNGSYMKLSLAAYSFNKQLGGRNWPKPSNKPGTMTLSDFIDFSADQNVDAVELTSYYFPNPLSKEYLLGIKEQTFRLGLDISGTAIGNDFCVLPGPARDAELQLCRQWIDFAAEMGAPVIRIFAGKIPAGKTEEQAIELCVDGINESLKYAAQRGVTLALENHHGITSTPAQLLSIVKQVTPSPWFGINFDSGNFLTADPYGDLEQIASYAVNAQVKVSIKPNGGAKQPSDLGRVVKILNAAGYRGYLVLEYEEPEDPRVEVPKYLDQLRELIHA